MELSIDRLDEKRFGLITGSKCSVLFPKRSAEVGQRTYAKELANQMFFKYYDEVGNWQTEHGNMAESEAYIYYTEHFDKNLVFKPEFIQLECWGGSADAIKPSDYGVDFKCPTSLSKWLDYLHEPLDDTQYYQCQMYMFLYKVDLWKICAFLTETFRMGEMGVVYPVDKNKRMIVIDVQKNEKFETLLRERIPKIIEMRDEFYNKLIEQFRK